MDRDTGKVRVNEDGKESPMKIYIRFKSTNDKSLFESHKQYLTRESPISVAFYAPKHFRQKYNNLMDFAKAWKSEQKDRNARFQLIYLDREDEMVIETRTGRYGGFTRLTDPFPSLFQMSLAMFDNLQGDGMIPNMKSKAEHIEENRKFRELKKTLNPVVRSLSAKRRIEEQSVDVYTEKLRKKSRGNSMSILGTNDSKHD